MDALTLIPVSEYLRTSYSPDCDSVDGEVQERNSGERDHADLQTRLVNLLCSPENEAYVTARTELRVHVSPTRFRVPDVCVLRHDAPRERVVEQPPVLCIEVLSPEDTMSRMRERIHDFLQMGVPEVWVVDAETRSVTVCAGATMEERTAGELQVPETPVLLSLRSIFDVLPPR
ncbi:MAG: Uma2 family endonuclease [Acidobacteriota bacterium]|nr:Uma2 family endonuclease [Acidobacteriota bacterium]